MGLQSGYLVASSDNFGVVDLWDVRAQRSHASYQLGLSMAREGRPCSEFDRVPVLCHAPPQGGLIASVRLLPSSPQVLMLIDLASGEQHVALPIHRNVRPSALGFHPT